MKNIFITIFSTAVILASGCGLFNNNKEASMPANSGDIKTMVLKAVNGDKTSNNLLSNLIDLQLPVLNDYNKITVDSARTFGGKKFYFIVLTFPNPVYNRFAIYDTTLRAYLIDKSLNGNVSFGTEELNNKRLFELTENFISKDVLKLQRISLYQIFDTTANLVFRTYTKLRTPTNVFTQTLSEISEDRIKTLLGSSKKSIIQNKADVFLFNPAQKKYVSQDSVFDNFVKAQVIGFKYKTELPAITDEKSALASTGINSIPDTIKTTSNTRDSQGFTLTLTGNWNTLRNFMIDDLLNKKFQGTRYINEVIGASISVIMIPSGDSAEIYTDYKLPNVKEGKYRVRYSDKILLRKDFLQYFEYSCGTKKYMVILRASKYTYDEYKTIYENIINSFTIDC